MRGCEKWLAGLSLLALAVLVATGFSSVAAAPGSGATVAASPSAPRQAAPTYVILVHGWNPDPLIAPDAVWFDGVDIYQQLVSAGYVVGVATYYGTFTIAFSNGTTLTDPSFFGTTGTPIESIGTELGHQLLRAFAGQHPVVDLVAHSMGGLVSEYMLEHVPLPGITVQNMVFLSSPLDGAPVTALTPYLNLSGYQATEMSQGSPFLTMLHAWMPTARHNQPTTEWLVYAGDADPLWAAAYFGAPNDGFVSDPSAEDIPYSHAYVFPDLHVPELDAYDPGKVSYFEDQNVANRLLANFAGHY